MASLRTHLVLGRVSNLPTVWSNCLAGWLLGGGGEWMRFVQLALGATLVYVGGMFLNDAFDAEFDRRHRIERPVPSGAISQEAVWSWGFIWLGLGTLSLILLGSTTALLAASLAASVVLYDATHKRLSWSPVLMAVCRFGLYLTAASVAEGGLNGLAIWSALVLAAYIIGLSYLARRESAGGVFDYWPLALLASPVVLAVIVNDGRYQWNGLLLSAVFALWTLRSLRPALWSAERNIGQTVAGLLAGIVLVDLLAVADVPQEQGAAFLLLFLAALLLQRVVPAT
jgi:4-hydroxybenzoate polyprenyltransferase